MDSIVNRVTERMATRTSRRGFMSLMGKAAMASAAAMAGGSIALRSGVSTAWADNPQCCETFYYQGCGSLSCPPGTSENLSKRTMCCNANDCKTHEVLCHYCDDAYGDPICVYATTTQFVCPCH